MIQTSIPEKLSIIVPVHNEADNILPLVKGISQSLSNQNYELILVDDGSTDATRQEIKKIKHPNLVFIELKKNYGQSLALAAGIDFASGDYIITMDGDLQNDPSDILKLYHKLTSEDWDLVVGVREKRKDNLFRKLLSKIANQIIKKSTKLDIQDHGCALKIFNKETAKELNLYGEMHRYISLVAHLNGAKVSEMTVNHHPRKFGKSKYGMGRTTKVINDLILLLFQKKYLQKPIHLFGNMGLISFLLGLIISFYLLYVKFGLGEDIGSRPLLILGIFLLFVGVQFFTTGFIIDLQMRTYFESQQMRPYKIRKIHIGETEIKKETPNKS